MAAYLDLLPEVLPDVPGCSDMLAERAIRNAVIRLCEGSDVLKHTPDAADIVIDEPRYEIATPDSMSFNQVMWVEVYKKALNARSSDYLDLAWREERAWRALFSTYHTLSYSSDPDGWRSYKQDRPEVYFIERTAGGDYLRLVGIPLVEIPGGLTYQVSLKPERAASEFPDWIAEDYYRAIAKGALAELLRIPKKAWTDTARGVTLEQEFDVAIGDIKRASLKDFTRDDQANGRTRAHP